MSVRKHPSRCPVSATLRLIGGKYKALILWLLMDRVLRFSRLQRLVKDATPKMLTQQLRELEEDGLVTRTIYPVVPPKVEYSLTAQGRSLGPILDAMYAWGVGRMEREGVPPGCPAHDESYPSARRCNGGCLPGEAAP